MNLGNKLKSLILSVIIQILMIYGIVSTNLLCIFTAFISEIKDQSLNAKFELTFSGCAFFLIFNAIGIFAVASNLRSTYSDPGIIKGNLKAPKIIPKEELKQWLKCSLDWKPHRAHHWSTWNSWIFKMDHHWLWVNNWIGIRNMKYFTLFLFYASLFGVVGFLLHLYTLLSYLLFTPPKNFMVEAFSYGSIWFLINIWGALIFPILWFPLFKSQLEVYEFNQTYIDDLKQLYGKPYEFWEGLKVHIGCDYMWWLLPTRPILDINYWERVFTESEIYSREFKNFENYVYDPQEKLKAQEIHESRVDKLIFLMFTLLFIAVACLIAK